MLDGRVVSQDVCMVAPKSMHILHIGVEIFRSISIENGIKVFKVHEVKFVIFLYCCLA